MKLLSLNVAAFEPNNKLLEKFLKSQKSDIVCLQEATRSIDESVDKKFVSVESINRATLDLRYFFFGPTSAMKSFEQKDFHGKEVFRFDFGGFIEFGNYTRSKFKLLEAQSVFLQNNFTYTTDYSKWPDEDYRAVLITDFDILGKPLRVMNYHGIWTRHKQGTEKTLEANKKINKLALKAKGEVIICGDFNLFPETPSMKVFERNFNSLVDMFKVERTRPMTNELSSKKRNVVDYIWVSKGIKVNKFNAIDTNISDHFPLILDFEIK